MFLIFLFSIVFTICEPKYNGETFCFSPTTDQQCSKTTVTYGKLCFMSFVNCRKFTFVPQKMWSFDRSKKECISQITKSSSAKVLFPQKKSCEAIYKQHVNKMMKRQARQSKNGTAECSSPSGKCPTDDDFIDISYAHIKRKKACYLQKTKPKQKVYQTYKYCAADNAARYCIRISDGHQCVFRQRKEIGEKLCFAHSSECELHSDWMRKIWFYEKNRKKCFRTLPHLKNSEETYYASEKNCMNMMSNSTCYELSNGRCFETKAYKKCYVLYNIFPTMSQCKQCTDNPNERYYIKPLPEGEKCIRSSFKHSHQSLHCTIDHCNQRLESLNTFFDSRQNGKYYSTSLACLKVVGRTSYLVEAFDTKEECQQMYQKKMRIMKESVAFLQHGGSCFETMLLHGRNIFPTEEACKKAAEEHRKVSFIILNNDRQCAVMTTDPKKLMRHLVFETLQDCWEDFDLRLDHPFSMDLPPLRESSFGAQLVDTFKSLPPPSNATVPPEHLSPWKPKSNREPLNTVFWPY